MWARYSSVRSSIRERIAYWNLEDTPPAGSFTADPGHPLTRQERTYLVRCTWFSYAGRRSPISFSCRVTARTPVYDLSLIGLVRLESRELPSPRPPRMQTPAATGPPAASKARSGSGFPRTSTKVAGGPNRARPSVCAGHHHEHQSVPIGADREHAPLCSNSAGGHTRIHRPSFVVDWMRMAVKNVRNQSFAHSAGDLPRTGGSDGAPRHGSSDCRSEHKLR